MARKIFNPQRYGSGFKQGYKTNYKYPFEDEQNQTMQDRFAGGRSRSRDPGQHSMSGKNQEAMARTIAQQRGAGDDQGTIRYIQRRMEHEQLKNVNQFVSDRKRGHKLNKYYKNIARTFDTQTIQKLHGLYQEGESMAIPTRPNKMESGQTIMHNSTGMIGVLNECTTMADRTRLVLQDRTLYVQSDEPGWTVLLDSTPVAASSAQGPALFKEQVDGPKKKKKEIVETASLDYERPKKDGTVAVTKEPRTSIPTKDRQKGPGSYALGPGLSAASGLAHSHPGGMEGFQKHMHGFAKEHNLPAGTQIMMLGGKGTKLPDHKGFDPTKTSSAVMSIGDHATYDPAKPPTKIGKKSGKEKTVGFAKMYKKANKVPIQDISNRFKGAKIIHGEMEGKPFTAYANIPKDGVIPNVKKQDYHTQTQGKKKIESTKMDFLSHAKQTKQKYTDEYTALHKEISGLPEGHPKIAKHKESMSAIGEKIKNFEYFDKHLAKEWGKNPVSVNIESDSTQKNYERDIVSQKIDSEVGKAGGKGATPAPVKPGTTSPTDNRKFSEGVGALIPGKTKGAAIEREAHAATITSGRSQKGLKKGKDSVQRALDLTKSEDYSSAHAAGGTVRLFYADEKGRDTRKVEGAVHDLPHILAQAHQKGYGNPTRASISGKFHDSSTANVDSTDTYKGILGSTSRSPKKTKTFTDKVTGEKKKVDMTGPGKSISFQQRDGQPTTSTDPLGGKPRKLSVKQTKRTATDVEGAKNLKSVGGERMISRAMPEVLADQKSGTDSASIRGTESTKSGSLYGKESKAYGREIKDKQTKPKTGKKKKEKAPKSSGLGGTEIAATLARTEAAEKFDAERRESLGETTATEKKKKVGREYADMGPFPGIFTKNI